MKENRKKLKINDIISFSNLQVSSPFIHGFHASYYTARIRIFLDQNRDYKDKMTLIKKQNWKQTSDSPAYKTEIKP